MKLEPPSKQSDRSLYLVHYISLFTLLLSILVVLLLEVVVVVAAKLVVVEGCGAVSHPPVLAVPGHGGQQEEEPQQHLTRDT